MAAAEYDLEPAVIDNGTWMCKAGYAGDKTAQVYERTVLGRVPATQDCDASEYIGEQACVHREFMELTYPMCRGAVTDWDTMERYWEYIFDHCLRAGIEGRPMLITEIPGGPTYNRRRMTEVLFEKFAIPSLYVSNPAYLSLLSNGRTTGVVLEVGGSTAHTTLVKNGLELKYCNQRSNVGGDDVTEWLVSTLRNKGHIQENRLTADNFKHYTSCSVFKPDMQTAHEYVFPDGTHIQLDAQLTSCNDVLFNPSMIGLQTASIDEILHETIRCCPPDLRSDICSNIIVAGGATMCIDVAEKLRAALERHGLTGQLKVIAPPERRKSAWLGGAILASLDEFPKIAKSRETYNDNGWREFLTFDYCDTILRAGS